jgi:hypothetical protein
MRHSPDVPLIQLCEPADPPPPSRLRWTLAWERGPCDLQVTFSALKSGPVSATVPAALPASLPPSWLSTLRHAGAKEQLASGERFTRTLLPEAILEGLARAVDTEPGLLPLEIRSCDGELLHLPWELLHLPGKGLLVREGRMEVFRRVIGAGEPLHADAPGPREDLADDPLRLLGLTPSPEIDQHLREGLGAAGFIDSRLFWEREQERLLVAMEPLLLQGRGLLHLPDEATLEHLSALLAVYQDLDILHLACHGGFPVVEPGQPLRPMVVLEDKTGKHRWVSAGELGGALRTALGDRNLPLAVISACDSAVARRSSEGVIPSFAAALLALAVDRTLGFQAKISDHGGIAFAAAFYASLAQGEDLLGALRSGRVALIRYGESGEWLLPALFVRCDPGPLISGFGPAAGAPALQVGDSSFAAAGISSLTDGFVGLRYLERDLTASWREGKRLIVLHGLGGIGKSTLACRFLDRRRADGCRVHALYAGRALSVDDLRRDLARHLGVMPPDPAAAANAEILERRWREVLSAALEAGPPTFYLLDNFEEHQTTAGGLKKGALGAALGQLATLPGLCLVITSRHVLRLPPNALDAELQSTHDVGDLPASACRKLRVLDPRGLGTLSAHDWLRALDLFGGHPKALLLLGAFLRHHPDDGGPLLDRLAEGLAVVDGQLAAERHEQGRRLLLGDLLADLPDAHRAAFDRLCLLSVPVDRDDLLQLLTADGCAEPAAALDWLQDRGLLAPVLGDAGLGLLVHRLLARHHLAAAPQTLLGWHLLLADFFEKRPEGPTSDFGVAARHADASGDRARALLLHTRWTLKLRKGFAFRAGETIAKQGLALFPPHDAQTRAAAACLWLEIFETGDSLGEPELRDHALAESERLVRDNDSAFAPIARANLAFCQGRMPCSGESWRRRRNASRRPPSSTGRPGTPGNAASR